MIDCNDKVRRAMVLELLLVLLVLLVSLLLAAGAPVVHAADERPIILAIGESTTAGFGVPPAAAWPAQLQRLLDAEGYRYRVVNHGRSGSTTAMALATLDRGIALRPAIVLVAIGGNDEGGHVPAAVSERNLRKLLSLFVHTGAVVYLAERTPASDRTSAAVQERYAVIAREEGALQMPSLRQDIAGNADLLLGDMQHPNEQGYAIVARRVLELLRPRLVK